MDDPLESDARAKSVELGKMMNAKRAALFGQLEKDKVRLESELTELRGFERQYRSRLAAYFVEQTRLLQGQGKAPDSVASPPANPLATE